MSCRAWRRCNTVVWADRRSATVVIRGWPPRCGMETPRRGPCLLSGHWMRHRRRFVAPAESGVRHRTSRSSRDRPPWHIGGNARGRALAHQSSTNWRDRLPSDVTYERPWQSGCAPKANQKKSTSSSPRRSASNEKTWFAPATSQRDVRGAVDGGHLDGMRSIRKAAGPPFPAKNRFVPGCLHAPRRGSPEWSPCRGLPEPLPGNQQVVASGQRQRLKQP